MSAETTKRVARVLSISGDGARTAIAAHVLAELERRTGQPVHKLFHMIVGEGAGAVLAMLLALRSVGGRVLPLGAEAAAIAIEESLPAFQPAIWHRPPGKAFRRRASARRLLARCRRSRRALMMQGCPS